MNKKQLTDLHCENMRPGSATPHTSDFKDAWEVRVSYEAGYDSREAEIRKLRTALESIIAMSHSWVITEENGALLAQVHRQYRNKAQEALNDLKAITND